MLVYRNGVITLYSDLEVKKIFDPEIGIQLIEKKENKICP